jgi:hypothetical protein
MCSSPLQPIDVLQRSHMPLRLLGAALEVSRLPVKCSHAQNWHELCFFHDARARSGPEPEASRSHSDAPHSVGLLWTSDQPVAETCNWQHTTHIRDRHTCPRGDSNPQSQQASCLGPTFVHFSDNSRSVKVLSCKVMPSKNVAPTLTKAIPVQAWTCP